MGAGLVSRQLLFLGELPLDFSSVGPRYRGFIDREWDLPLHVLRTREYDLLHCGIATENLRYHTFQTIPSCSFRQGRVRLLYIQGPRSRREVLFGIICTAGASSTPSL